jgi:hypothetical protein
MYPAAISIVRPGMGFCWDSIRPYLYQCCEGIVGDMEDFSSLIRIESFDSKIWLPIAAKKIRKNITIWIMRTARSLSEVSIILSYKTRRVGLLGFNLSD